MKLYNRRQMRYKSNLEAPDLSGYFKLLDPPKQILGHDAPSDPDYEPGCTFITHDEGAILFNVARQVPGLWLDLGSRFLWSSAHIAAADRDVCAVDTAYDNPSYLRRASDNKHEVDDYVDGSIWIRRSWPQCSIAGAFIDGNHDSPEPLNDAMKAAALGAYVILLHDFWGSPIRDAANWLLDQGWRCRVYWTPNGVACLWRGLPDFIPLDHVRDPALEGAWENIRRECEKDFDFRRTI